MGPRPWSRVCGWSDPHWHQRDHAYFAPQIFSDAGFTFCNCCHRRDEIIVGVVNVLATFVAIRYIDRSLVVARCSLSGSTIMVASG